MDSVSRPRGHGPGGGAPHPDGGWWPAMLFGALAVAVGVGLIEFIPVIRHALALVLAAIVMAAALAPLVDRLGRLLPRPLAVLLVYLTLLLALGGFLWFLSPRLLDQLTLLVDALPGLLDQGRAAIERFDRLGPGRLGGILQSRLRQFLGPLVSLPLTLITYLTDIVLILSMSAYWLIAAPALRRFCLSLFPVPQRRRIDDIAAEALGSMGGYVRGVAIDSLIIGAIVYAGLAVIGLEYALPLAVFAGLTETVPIVGPIVGAIPAIGIGLLHSPTQGLIVLGFFVVVQQLESNLLTPFVMRSQTDVPPILTLLALLVGAAIGGLFWALVAIPVSGALRVLALRVLAPAVRRRTGADDTPPGTPSPGPDVNDANDR